MDDQTSLTLEEVAQSALRIMVEHSGPVSARLAWALERSHLYVERVQQRTLSELAIQSSGLPHIREWFSELETARSGMRWGEYTNALPLDDRQHLAKQLLDALLGMLDDADIEAVRPPALRGIESQTVGEWEIPTPEASPLYARPEWWGRDAGCSTRLRRFRLTAAQLPRARQLTRSLQHEIRNTFEATVLPEATPEGNRPTADIAALRASNVLVLVQALNEMFIANHLRATEDDPSTSIYEAHMGREPGGRVVGGFKFLRNAVVHDPFAFVAFDVKQIVTAQYVDGSKGFRVFPRWVEFDQLPSIVRHGRKTGDRYKEMYQSHVAGRNVLETMLDALRFLLDCDPGMARLVVGGYPAALPLEAFPLPIGSTHRYERAHPYQLTEVEWDRELRDAVGAQAPTGSERAIKAVLRDEHGEVVAYCGDTLILPGQTTAFTETPEQVLRDVEEHGFPYQAVIDSQRHPVTAAQGTLRAGGADLSQLMPDAEPFDGRLWRGWFELVSTDAQYWANQQRHG